MQQQISNGKRTAGPPNVRAGEAVPPAIAAVLEEVREQSRRTRRTQQGFAIFAVLAFALALVNLVVIAAKLDGGTTTTRVVSAAAATKPAAAATGAGAAALPHTVNVGLAEFSVKPSAPAAAAGKVTFAVHNGGKLTHEFVVIRTDKPAGSLLKGARADESGNVGETGDLAAGASKRLTLKLPPGHYALVCNLPGHYAAGQHVDFTVKRA